jgi:hypothetical protein
MISNILLTSLGFTKLFLFKKGLCSAVEHMAVLSRQHRAYSLSMVFINMFFASEKRGQKSPKTLYTTKIQVTILNLEVVKMAVVTELIGLAVFAMVLLSGRYYYQGLDKSAKRQKKSRK